MLAWIERHPNLTTWAVLAFGMVVILAWSARGVALTPTQRLWLGLATVLLAGLCAWIISWEADEETDDEDPDDVGDVADQAAPAQQGAAAASGGGSAPSAETDPETPVDRANDA